MAYLIVDAFFQLKNRDFENLQKGRQYLRDIVERQGIPIFTDIPDAINSAVRVIKEGIRPQDLTVNDNVIPVKMGHICVGDKWFQMSRVFQTLKNQNNELTFKELPLAYRTLTNKNLSDSVLQELARCHIQKVNVNVGDSEQSNTKILQKSITNSNMLPPFEQIAISFDQFCCIISELQQNIELQPTEIETNGIGAFGRQLIQLPLYLVMKFVRFLSIIKSLLYDRHIHSHHSSASYHPKNRSQHNFYNGASYNSSQKEQPKRRQILADQSCLNLFETNRKSSTLTVQKSAPLSPSVVTSLVYDYCNDLYIGGVVEQSYLNNLIIPLLK